jgi:hypothetical protein
MQTITVYCYAIKYWLGGASWDEAYEVAVRLVYWPGGNY